MCFVDQGFEIVGAAIDAVGRVPQHAVIAQLRCPAKSASGINSSAVMPVATR